MLENACKTRFWKQLRQVGKAVEIPVNPRELPSAGVGYTCSSDYSLKDVVLPLLPRRECTAAPGSWLVFSPEVNPLHTLPPRGSGSQISQRRPTSLRVWKSDWTCMSLHGLHAADKVPETV